MHLSDLQATGATISRSMVFAGKRGCARIAYLGMYRNAASNRDWYSVTSTRVFVSMLFSINISWDPFLLILFPHPLYFPVSLISLPLSVTSSTFSFLS